MKCTFWLVNFNLYYTLVSLDYKYNFWSFHQEYNDVYGQKHLKFRFFCIICTLFRFQHLQKIFYT